ncbi:MAG TPA: serine hydrolase domain-containing protein, partial [Vicinamibacterales bacterium]|nr:serine hydrolase domain-containing protein [Vicinamibacterales bacterium]
MHISSATFRGALVGAALVCSVGFTATHANLDAAIRTLMGTERVPGLSFAVVRGGRIVRTGSYGFANLEWKTPVSVHTKFEIASISKMFAGAAARILIEDGKLDPESPVGAYFHGIPDSWRGMKVRHLITMSSGLPEDFG